MGQIENFEQILFLALSQRTDYLNSKDYIEIVRSLKLDETFITGMAIYKEEKELFILILLTYSRVIFVKTQKKNTTSTQLYFENIENIEISYPDDVTTNFKLAAEFSKGSLRLETANGPQNIQFITTFTRFAKQIKRCITPNPVILETEPIGFKIDESSENEVSFE